MSSGLIGAAIGLALGIVDYWLMEKFLISKVEKQEMAGSKEPGNAALLRKMLWPVCFVVFPLFGYYAGGYDFTDLPLPYGLVGASFGFALGWIQYYLARKFVFAKLEERMKGSGKDEQVLLLDNIVKVLCFVALPLSGYLVGTVVLKDLLG